MKYVTNLLVVFVILFINGCASGGGGTAEDNTAQLVNAAIANPERRPADVERDARDRPDVTLAFLNLQPGEAAVDLFAGGGYYSELLAGVVGPEGDVVLHNNAGYAKWVEKDLQARYIDNSVPPIRVVRSEVDDLQLPAQSFDAAVMVMSYHDLYYYNPERGFDKTDVPAFFAQVHAALKPGARLLVIDHAAPAGTGSEYAQDIHRIDEAFARGDIESNGFSLIATSDVLRNSDDPRTEMVFAKDIRGETDRFVMVFERD